MKTKPILFNTEMVQAILDGRKTQTRRAVKGIEGLNVYRAEPAEDAYESLAEWDFFYGWSIGNAMYDAIESVKAPCAVGDILWVRETWCKYWLPGEHVLYRYKATHPNGNKRPTSPEYDEPYEIRPWEPSIHMPKEAARIFLQVKNIRAERLQNMTEEDAIAEGFPDSPDDEDSPLERFAVLWYKTVKLNDLHYYGFHANPWVWVIEFERCDKPEGWCD